MSQWLASGDQNTGASASVSPTNEYSGLTSLRTDWFDLLAVQGTLRTPPAPQFGSINSLALCLLYSPALTTTRDHQKTIALLHVH